MIIGAQGRVGIVPPEFLGAVAANVLAHIPEFGKFPAEDFERIILEASGFEIVPVSTLKQSVLAQMRARRGARRDADSVSNRHAKARTSTHTAHLNKSATDSTIIVNGYGPGRPATVRAAIPRDQKEAA